MSSCSRRSTVIRTGLRRRRLRCLQLLQLTLQTGKLLVLHFKLLFQLRSAFVQAVNIGL
ncbi:hypothetical protein D3C75_1152430 [compost metagenome]